MKEDFSELIEYLDKKFTQVDERFDKMEREFSDLQGSVDAYAKKADTYFQDPVKVTS